MRRMSTKSLIRIAKPGDYDKVTVGMLGIFIFASSITTYEKMRLSSVDAQIRSDDVLNRKNSTMIFHGKR